MLQGVGSDVSLTIPPGTQGVYMTGVHTDHTMFPSVIPKEECIVGPLVEVEHLGTIKKTSKTMYKLQIAHCVQNQDLWEFIRVRRGDPNKGIEFTELTQREKHVGASDYYVIDENYITIFTSHFTLFTCTNCKNSCNATVMAFLVGELEHLLEYGVTKVKVKAFLCSDLFTIADFKNVCLPSLFK